MSTDAKEDELCLKIFINKEKTKVLFAEAGSDFADVLLSFMMLPLGRIVKILERHYGDNAPTIGSLTTLYKGLSNPDTANLWTQYGKELLDNPRSLFDFSDLKVRVDDSHPSRNNFGKSYSEVFTQISTSFLFSDDLRLVPNVTGSILDTLDKLGIDVMETEGAEMINVTFGLKEIVDLLKASFASRTPLSDLILGNNQIGVKAEMLWRVTDEISLHQFRENAICCYGSMYLKVMFQKSTNKLLFAQAGKYFVYYLFCLFLIPLGTVEWLLLGNTCVNNIDNLYKSITGLIYPRGTGSRQQLLNPGVCNLYESVNIVHCSTDCDCDYSGDFVEQNVTGSGYRMYMVTDDLTVTHLSMSSTLPLLNQMKISLSDVEEVEFYVGKKELLSILKASLISNRALTDGLINPKFKEQPMPQV
ncbi:hypothetical protein ACS0TY_030952 [Phlomoides rotata]